MLEILEILYIQGDFKYCILYTFYTKQKCISYTFPYILVLVQIIYDIQFTTKENIYHIQF